jgi:uncharacterized protein (DUF58 family)
MKLYPTRITFHVAAAGLVMLVFGVVFKNAPLAGFGCAVVLAIAVGRYLAHASVSHLRRAGFEMVWKTEGRISRITQGETLSINAELRNRGADDLRGLKVMAIASAQLQVHVEPETLELPGGETKKIRVIVHAPRIGRFGLHGIALDVRGVPVGGDSLYEAPLMFANPHGIEVVPNRQTKPTEVGGIRRSQGRSLGLGQRKSRGDGDEFRELREMRSSDPYKGIAWKASARRGKLLVRETEAHTEGHLGCPFGSYRVVRISEKHKCIRSLGTRRLRRTDECTKTR